MPLPLPLDEGVLNLFDGSKSSSKSTALPTLASLFSSTSMVAIDSFALVFLVVILETDIGTRASADRKDKTHNPAPNTNGATTPPDLNAKYGDTTLFMTEPNLETLRFSPIAKPTSAPTNAC